jgi:hypothetical protein
MIHSLIFIAFTLQSVLSCTDLCPPNVAWFKTGEECYCSPPADFSACAESPNAIASACIKEYSLVPVNPSTEEKTGCNVYCSNWISFQGTCFCNGEKTKVEAACADTVAAECIAISGAVSAGTSTGGDPVTTGGNSSSSATVTDASPNPASTVVTESGSSKNGAGNAATETDSATTEDGDDVKETTTTAVKKESSGSQMIASAAICALIISFLL